MRFVSPRVMEVSLSKVRASLNWAKLRESSATATVMLSVSEVLVTMPVPPRIVSVLFDEIVWLPPKSPAKKKEEVASPVAQYHSCVLEFHLRSWSRFCPRYNRATTPFPLPSVPTRRSRDLPVSRALVSTT